MTSDECEAVARSTTPAPAIESLTKCRRLVADIDDQAPRLSP